VRLDHLLSRETRHPALEVELLRGTDFRSSLPGFQITALFSLFLELGTGNEPGRNAGRARFVPRRPGQDRAAGTDLGAREGGGGARRLRGLDPLSDFAEGVGL
jgi:hypothetical protein